MTVDDAVAVIQRAARGVAPAELHAAAVADGCEVRGPHYVQPVADVYRDGEALAAAVAAGEPGAVGAALRALARRDGEALLEPALLLAEKARAELRSAAAFALAYSTDQRALIVLLGALPPAVLPPAALARSVHPHVNANLRAALAETGVTVFVMRDWPRIDRWLAMAPDERRALAPATRAGTEVGRGGELIRMLGARGDLESLELMIRMLAGHPERAIRMACAHALAALPDPRAHAALDAHWADADSSIGNVAVRAAVFRDLATVWSRFLPAIQIVLDRRSDTPVEEEIVRRLLYVCHGGALPRKLAPDGDPLVVEPRLIELAARLRRHDYIGQWARSVLGVSPRAAALAAIERYPHEPVLARVALPERRDFLARYLAGERGAWNELIEHALAVVQHAELRAEAHAVAREIMKRVRHNAEAVRATLCEAGARVAPIGTPADDGELARLEAELGAPAPIALDAFWRVAGAIALVPDGDDRHDYGPCALERDGIALIALDPLVVAGARHALEAAARQQRDIAASHREIVGPLWLDFAPDYLHKQNISGGAPYAIELPAPQPADAVDPRVTYYRHRLRFVDYLRHAFHWAGFPILEVAHRPVDRIAANDRIAFERVSGEWGAAADRLLARLRANLVDF